MPNKNYVERSRNMIGTKGIILTHLAVREDWVSVGLTVSRQTA